MFSIFNHRIWQYRKFVRGTVPSEEAEDRAQCILKLGENKGITNEYQRDSMEVGGKTCPGGKAKPWP